MEVRTLAALAGLLMAGGALSGCLESPSFLFTSDVEATARDNLDLAAAAATAWRPDARLVSVMTFESSEAEKFDLPSDPDVGNGRALGWWYAYASANESTAFKVEADGTVTQENDTEMADAYTGMAMPLGEWPADSDDALASARADERFLAAATAPNATIVEGIADMDGESDWYIVAMSKTAFIVAIVDGRTAELQEVQTMDFEMPDMPDFDMGMGGASAPDVELHEEGDVGMTNPHAEYEFELGSAALAHLDLSAEGLLPTDGLYWSIMLLNEEDDDEKYETVAEGEIYSWDEDAVSEELDLEAGEYMIMLHYSPATRIPITPGEVEYVLDFHAGGGDWDFDYDWG